MNGIDADTFYDVRSKGSLVYCGTIMGKFIPEVVVIMGLSLSEVDITAACWSRSKKWTFETAKAEAALYATRHEWRKNSPKSYNAAANNHWLSSAAPHMSPLRRRWALKDVLADASTYASYSEWTTSRAYSTASRNGWLPRVREHFGTPSLTKEQVMDVARQCRTRADFTKRRSEYHHAYAHGYLDEIYAFLVPSSATRRKL